MCLALCIHNGRAYELMFMNVPGTESTDRTLFLGIISSFSFTSAAG